MPSWDPLYSREAETIPAETTARFIDQPSPPFLMPNVHFPLSTFGSDEPISSVMSNAPAADLNSYSSDYHGKLSRPPGFNEVFRPHFFHPSDAWHRPPAGFEQHVPLVSSGSSLPPPMPPGLAGPPRQRMSSNIYL